MGAADFRHLLSVEKTEDGAAGRSGTKVIAHNHIGHAQCEIRELSGSEFVEAQQINGSITVQLRMRRDSVTQQITSRDRLVEQSGDRRTFEVLHVLNSDGRRRERRALCKEAD